MAGFRAPYNVTLKSIVNASEKENETTKLTPANPDDQKSYMYRQQLERERQQLERERQKLERQQLERQQLERQQLERQQAAERQTQWTPYVRGTGSSPINSQRIDVGSPTARELTDIQTYPAATFGQPAVVSQQRNQAVMNQHQVQQLIKENQQLKQINQQLISQLELQKNDFERRLEKKESEIERTTKQLVDKNKEVRELYSLLDAHTSKKQEKKNEGHEKVHDEFYNHFDSIEFRLPKKVKDFDKQEFWRTCCELYQLSFFTCREAIHGVFSNSLINITELSKVEEESGEINLDRQEELESAKAAYQYLLKQSATELSKYNKDSLVEKVMSSLPHDDKIKSILHEQAVKAVEICWKMQTVSPPMFLCQPKIYNDEWHLPHSKSWNDPPGELIYYRPVLMYSAGGTVAHKGFVGSKPGDPKGSLMPRQDSSEGEFKSLPTLSSNRRVHSPKVGANDDSTLPLVSESCSCGNEIFIEGLCRTCYSKTICGGCRRKLHDIDNAVEYDGKHWHKICLPVKMTCSACKNKVDSAESCKKGDHYYHHDCFSCSQCNKKILEESTCHISTDGSVLWCKECLKSCYFCEKRFPNNAQKFGIQKKVACQSCGNLFKESKCFRCKQPIISQSSKVEKDRGIYHKSCVCSCHRPIAGMNKICASCRKLIIQ